MSAAPSSRACGWASELSGGGFFLARAGPIARALAAAMLAALAASSARAGDSLESAIKATYLYKFAPFVGWPDSAFANAQAPLVLCVEGDPFGSILDRAVAKQAVGSHPIAIKRVESAQKAAGCHILYIAPSQAQSVADAVAATKGAPMLTVAEGAGTGAVIGFVIRDQRVRFVVDLRAAAENNLKISSRLLSLALDVEPRKP